MGTCSGSYPVRACAAGVECLVRQFVSLFLFVHHFLACLGVLGPSPPPCMLFLVKLCVCLLLYEHPDSVLWAVFKVVLLHHSLKPLTGIPSTGVNSLQSFEVCVN